MDVIKNYYKEKIDAQKISLKTIDEEINNLLNKIIKGKNIIREDSIELENLHKKKKIYMKNLIC